MRLLPVLLATACVNHAPPEGPSPTASTLESLSAQRAACRAGDELACLGLIASLMDTGQPGLLEEALHTAALRCNLGEVAACMIGLHLADDIGLDERPLEKMMWDACLFGFSTSCKQLTWRMLNQGRHDEAKQLVDVLCLRKDALSCALSEGILPLEPPSAPALPEDFTLLLEEAGAVFEHPSGFEAAPVVDNPDHGYQHAIRSSDGALEMRYSVVPHNLLAQGIVDQTGQPPQAALEMINAAAPAALQAAAMNISGTEDPLVGEFPQLAVLVEFGAQWGLQSGGPVRDSFSADYEYFQMFMLHRDGQAELMIIMLYNGLTADSALMSSAFHALRFEDGLDLTR
jgi:hypothetical protein